MQDIQAEFPGSVDVGVEHLADKLDGRGLVWVLLIEVHDQSKSAIFERGVCGADNDCVPVV